MPSRGCMQHGPVRVTSMKFTRPRDSLRNAVRVSLVMDGDTKERLRCLSERTKASQSAIVDWLVENAETDDQGRIAALVSAEEELPDM